MISDNIDLIIHHADCPDGWCAAFIAKKCFPNAEVLGRMHGQELPNVTNRRVLVVDFSWRTREQNQLLASDAESFHILDHHATATEVLTGLDFATFDLNRSGATITWDTLFPDEWRPWYVEYVEDRDLWRWQLPQTKEVNAYIMTLPHTTSAWTELDHIDVSEAARRGVGALAQVHHYIEKVTAQKLPAVIQGFRASIVNASYTNISDVCHELLEQDPSIDVGAGWFLRGDGQVQFSFRSRKDGPDVSKIAQHYGGGGHPHAAGAQQPMQKGLEVVREWLGGER